VDFWLGLQTLSGIVPRMLFPPTQDVKAATASDDTWLKPGWFAVLLALLTLASYPQVFFGFQTFVYRDFGLFSYPLAYHFRESFWHGELPLWNPLNNCGTPFLAQWNTQVLYPPALFYLLFPLSWSLGVFCLLHLFWGGLGMFFLARHRTQNHLAAAFAGIIFAFNGLMLSSLIWPATVAGLAWMPWVIWLTERAWREGGRTLILAAVAGAMQMLSGGTEVTLLTWVLLGAVSLFEFIRRDGLRAKILWRTGLVVLLISGLCAAQLLPFLDLLDYSRRQEGISATLWPMPLTGWANFFVPLFHCHSYQGVFMQDNQSWINSYYVGVATLVLALGTMWRARQGRVWLLAALAGSCLILALGDATPVYGWLSRHVGVVSLMRFPIKFVILTVFVLPLLAAYGLAEIQLAPGVKSIRQGAAWGLVWFAVVVLILGILWWNWRSQPSDDDRTAVWWNGLSRVGFFTAMVGGWWLAGRIPVPESRRLWQLLLLLLVWLDVYQQAPRPQTVSRTIFQPGLSRPLPAPRFGETRALVPFATSAALGHVFLPDVTANYVGRRFTLSCDCSLLDDIPNGDGFFPLCLSRYAAVFYTCYKSNTPETLLDFIGVSQTLAVGTNRCEWVPRSTGVPLLTGGQKPVFTDDLAAVQMFTNANFNPGLTVCLPEEAKPFITASNTTAVKISSPKFSAGKIEAVADAADPALLVAAQIYYHPWRAYVDGQPVRLWPANFAFQAFEIPAGSHRVKLVYEDRRFYLGSTISLATLAGCLVFYCLSRRRPASVTSQLVKRLNAVQTPLVDE
jgi:hypothetical protein